MDHLRETLNTVGPAEYHSILMLLAVRLDPLWTPSPSKKTSPTYGGFGSNWHFIDSLVWHLKSVNFSTFLNPTGREFQVLAAIYRNHPPLNFSLSVHVLLISIVSKQLLLVVMRPTRNLSFPVTMIFLTITSVDRAAI